MPGSRPRTQQQREVGDLAGVAHAATVGADVLAQQVISITPCSAGPATGQHVVKAGNLPATV